MPRPTFYILLIASLTGCAIQDVNDDPPEPAPPSRHAVADYFRDRGMDFGDMFKFGAELGPGVGLDAMVSTYLRAAAMKRWTKGLGFETFRHSPFKNAHEGYAEFGPMARTQALSGHRWPIDTWDVRIDAQVLVVGAHVAVNPVEIGDFLAGLMTFDPVGDDGL